MHFNRNCLTPRESLVYQRDTIENSKENEINFRRNLKRDDLMS